jgi:Ca2+-binding RTX toxin-like protein
MSISTNTFAPLSVADVIKVHYSGDIRIDALIESALANTNWNFYTPAVTNTLSYSFDISSGIENSGNGGINYATGRAAFNSSQIAAVRAIFTYATTVTGIQFVEASSGASANIHFANADVIAAPLAGVTFAPFSASVDATGTLVTAYSGNAYVYIDNNEWGSLTSVADAGAGGYQLLLHEIGHALGLKHPFEAPYTLSSADNNTNNTVMSYTFQGANKTAYQTDDLLALQWLYGGHGLSTAKAQPTAGNDFFMGRVGNDILAGLNGNDTLYGWEGNDTLDGGAGNDGLYGGDGNDVIDGGVGVDTLTGGLGNDTYSVDSSSDVIIETSTLATEIDLVKATANYSLSNNIENLTFYATKNLQGTGNALNNIITGNIGNNVISGLDGNDKLLGGLGNDSLNGGIGNDTLNGGAGKDIISGGAGNDRIVFAAGVSDTVAASNSIAGVDLYNDLSLNKTLADRLDLTVAVKAIGTKVTGSVNELSFIDNLNSLLTTAGKGFVQVAGGIDAAVVIANAGSLSGHSFLAVDLNSSDSFSNTDFVIEITGSTVTSLTTTTFI